MIWLSAMRSKRYFLRRTRTFCAVLAVMTIFLLTCGGWIEMGKLNVKAEIFEESSRLLQNPNRGFYRIYGFQITDDATDYTSKVDELYDDSDGFTLALIEINLKAYRSKDISPAGLNNIDALFKALSSKGKRLIVRFLYDWEKKNLLTEPSHLDRILRHMEQLQGILRRNAEQIFTLQGLFVGDWGEMHNTRYHSAEDLRRLAKKLAGVSKSFLAVRTPVQWRLVTEDGADEALAARIGLFNDGMLGSDTDLGTYNMEFQGEQRRSREEELAFQETLCRSVPNGGEVVVSNPFNDFGNAVRDLSAMHVTYLNRDYDTAVMEKWAAATVFESGCFNGMDGLSYIERHLGYRLLISEVKLERGFFQNQLTVKVFFRNEGFAPLYEEPEVMVSLRDADGGLIASYPAEHNLRDLPGGTETEKAGMVQASIPTKALSKGAYKLYLTLKDPVTEKEIFLANTQDSSPYGYCLGEMEVIR